MEETTSPDASRPEPSRAEKGRSDRALIVIDMVARLVHGEAGQEPVPGAADLIPFIQGELRYFRERDRVVVFATTQSRGVPGSPIVSGLTPRTGEVLLDKPAPDAFFGTDLEDRLREAGVGRVTLAGVGTATSILLTAGGAYARGLGVSVPEPCAADPSPTDHQSALHLIRQVWRPVGGDRTLNEVTSPALTMPPTSRP